MQGVVTGAAPGVDAILSKAVVCSVRAGHVHGPAAAERYRRALPHDVAAAIWVSRLSPRGHARRPFIFPASSTKLQKATCVLTSNTPVRLLHERSAEHNAVVTRCASPCLLCTLVCIKVRLRCAPVLHHVACKRLQRTQQVKYCTSRPDLGPNGIHLVTAARGMLVTHTILAPVCASSCALQKRSIAACLGTASN
jgi:hypothetical protein